MSNSGHPLHLAIIPDGNRRWAKARSLFPWNGHDVALRNFHRLTEWCMNEPRIGVLTIWGFSTENWNRSGEEVSHLMVLFERYLQKEREHCMENNIRFLHSGRTDRIPASLASLIAAVTQETADNTSFTFHLALDYGGRDEIVRAANKCGGVINDQTLRAHVDQPDLPDIDLIIRTSGEYRTSNFFLWQSAYAEWMFVQKHFPDFTPEDLAAALEEYCRRSRRFGT